VFPVRYDHLHIKSKAISVTGRGGSYVFSVCYEHHLYINCNVIRVIWRGDTQVFPVRYEHHPHIKRKAISLTGIGDPYVCDMLSIPHCLDNRLADGGEPVTVVRRPRFTSKEYYWY
jgi:hypothetical protein